MADIHTLFFQFTCGHEYYDRRVPGGVSDWTNCLCNSCQPYDAIVLVSHPCCFCDGSLSYCKDDPQIRLSEEDAKERLNNAIPLYGNHEETKVRIERISRKPGTAHQNVRVP